MKTIPNLVFFKGYLVGTQKGTREGLTSFKMICHFLKYIEIRQPRIGRLINFLTTIY